jgi:hypothetical protein
MERLQEDTGTHLVAWDGSNDAGERLPPGAYFVTVHTYSATAGGKGDASPAREQTERVLLLR